MKKLVLGIFALIISSVLQAQVYNGDVEFSEQIQIDQFVNDNPSITTINGYLFITTVIEPLELSGLSDLTTINGVLYITGEFNMNIIDFSNHITSVQELQIQVVQTEPAEVFTNLTTVPIAIIDVTSNILSFPNLINIDYLANTLENSTGATEFPNCDNLHTLHIRAQANFNFPILSYISYVHVEDFDLSIQSIQGIESVTSVDSVVIFNAPFLENISGFQSLQTINNFFKIEMSSIQDVSPLENISFAEELTFFECTNLQTLPIFLNSPTINYLNIVANSNLSSISGLESASIGNHMLISSNPNLSICSISSVCEFLNSFPNQALIYSNAPDCNSIPIISAQCNAENEIHGNVFIDGNCDGILNDADYILENEIIQVSFVPTENTLVYYSNQFNVFAPSTTQVTLSAYSQPGYTTTPVIVDPTVTPTIFENTNLGLCPIENYNNLGISIANSNAVIPGFQTQFFVTISNTGTMVESGIGSVTFNSPYLQEIITTSLGTINGNTIDFETISIQPLTSITFEISCQISANAVLGDFFNAIAEITSQIQSETELTDNISSSQSPIIGSYDPNNKLVNHAQVNLSELVESSEIELTYTINFQNTGTAPAINIRVEDALPEGLNLETFEMIASSHPYNYSISGNEIIWYFNDILLPDSNTNEPESHGWFSFKVSTFGTNVEGDQIANQVGIFFDFNEPIITNLATTNFVDCQDNISVFGNLQTCVGGTIELSILDDNFTSVQWTINNEVVSETLAISQIFNEAATYEVLLHAENANCIYNENVSVTIIPNQEINLTYTAPLITTDIIASNYQWYFEGELIEGANESSFEPNQTGNYFVIASTEAACPSQGSIYVVICPDPPTIIGPSEVCGLNIELFSTPDNTYPILNWYFEDVYISSASEVPLAFAMAGEYNIILEVGDENCTTTSSILVTAYEVPIVEIFNMDNTLFTQVLADSYQWYLDGNPIEGANASVYNPTEPGVYSLFVVFESGCENESNAINFTIGIDEINNLEFSIFPNPFQQTMNLIVAENAVLPLQIEIYDMMGKKVHSNTSYLKSNQLDVTTIASGAYLCRIIDTEGKTNSRIIEKK